MPGQNQRETGVRIPAEKSRSDANNEMSQKAAENKKPPLGVGLTEKLSERSESDKTDLDQRPTTAKEGRADRNK